LQFQAGPRPSKFFEVLQKNGEVLQKNGEVLQKMVSLFENGFALPNQLEYIRPMRLN